MKYRCLFIGCWMWLSLFGLAQTPNLVVRHLSDITDVGQTTINDIYQDENGCMWFATREGVIRYNGNRTEHIVPLLNDSVTLTSPIVTVLSGDGNGHVFFGADMVHCFDMRTHAISRCWSQPMQTLTSSDSIVYIASAPYVFAYHIASAVADTLACLPIDPTDRINHLDYFPGKLYVCTSKGDVLLLDLNTYHCHVICQLGSCISFAREDQNGILWIGTWENGLYQFSNGQLQTVDIPCSFVRDIAFTSDGSIWVGTHQGLYRYAADGEISRVHGLTNQSVWRVYVDIEGTLWIGSYFGGIDYLNPISNVYHYWPLPQIDGNTPIVNSIIPVNERQYYLCTEGNGLLLYDLQSGVVKQYLSSRASNIKSSYYDAEHHQLYIGLHLYGLCSFNPLTKSYQYYRLPYSPFYQNQVIRSIIPLDDDLLCGTYNGVYQFSPATGLIIPFSDTLNHLLPMVCDLQIDQRHQLWVAGDGIARYNLLTQQVDVFQSMLTHAAEQVSVVEDQLFIGTQGYGVWVSPVDSFCPQPIAGIKNKFVHNMQILPNGQLLIIFTDGMIMYDVASERVQTYSYANGLPLHSLYNGACAILPDSSVMLAGMDGIVIFNPSSLYASMSSPHIVIDNVQINGKLHIADSSVTLAAHSLLSLDVTTDYYFTRPNLRYTLSLWNNQWIDIKPEASMIRLADLPAGKHTLRIEAYAADNNNLLASREFIVFQRPPFYLSILAFVLYALLLAGLVYIVAQRMKRHYQRKAEWEWQQKMLQGGDAISKVYAYINEHLSDENLNVEVLVSHVGVSRTKLFTIVKNNTGLTPNDLIMRTRLKKAAELLTDPKAVFTISEIGYDVGFSSPKYFAKCFKNFYHQTPSDYRLSH